MGRAARANPCSYAGGKRLPEVVTNRMARQLARDDSDQAFRLWLTRARFTDAEKAFVKAGPRG